MLKKLQLFKFSKAEESIMESFVNVETIERL